MIRSVTQPCRSCHGIQCGIARMSIVASTGSPSSPLIEQRFAGPHRLVVAHVLVDGQRDARPLAKLHDLLRLAIIHPQRLLRQDAADVLLVLAPPCLITSICTSGGTAISTTSTLPLASISSYVSIRLQPMPLRHPPRMRRRPRRNRHRIEPRLPIRHQMAIRHDEPAADAADRRRFVLGEAGEIVEVDIIHRTRLRPGGPQCNSPVRKGRERMGQVSLPPEVRYTAAVFVFAVPRSVLSDESHFSVECPT